jgi:hypothetical protein
MKQSGFVGIGRAWFPPKQNRRIRLHHFVDIGVIFLYCKAKMPPHNPAGLRQESERAKNRGNQQNAPSPKSKVKASRFHTVQNAAVSGWLRCPVEIAKKVCRESGVWAVRVRRCGQDAFSADRSGQDHPQAFADAVRGAYCAEPRFGCAPPWRERVWNR